MNNNFNGMNSNDFQSNIPDNMKTGFDSYSNMNGNKKKNNLVVILFFLILVAGVAFGAFQFGKMYSGKTVKVEETGNKEQKNDNETEVEKAEEKVDSNEKPKEEPVKNSNYTFYKERKETLKVGNNDIEVVAYYYLDSGEYIYNEVKSLYNVLRREIFFNGKRVLEPSVRMVFEGNNDVDQTIQKDELNTFKTFMDSYNKEDIIIYYLYTVDPIYNGNYLAYQFSQTQNAYVIGLNGNVYQTIQTEYAYFSTHGVLTDSTGLGDRNFIATNASDHVDPELDLNNYPYIIYSDSLIDIHDKFIYYIEVDTDYNNPSIIEYKISIDNGKFNKEKITEYSYDRFICAGGC